MANEPSLFSTPFSSKARRGAGNDALTTSSCPLLGVKRTCRLHCKMSAFDPKRTFRIYSIVFALNRIGVGIVRPRVYSDQSTTDKPVDQMTDAEIIACTSVRRARG